jgi:hypothetical protein
MISIVADLKTWAVALATGALLSPPLQAERLAVRPFAQSPTAGYGLGILDAYGFLGHSGGIFGGLVAGAPIRTRRSRRDNGRGRERGSGSIRAMPPQTATGSCPRSRSYAVMIGDGRNPLTMR